jgi:hypothetical protein
MPLLITVISRYSLLVAEGKKAFEDFILENDITKPLEAAGKKFTVHTHIYYR